MPAELPSKSFIYTPTNPGAQSKWLNNKIAAEFLASPELPIFDWRGHDMPFVFRHQGDWNACTSFAFSAMVELRRHLHGKPFERLMGGFVHFCLLGERDPNQGRNPPETLVKAMQVGIKAGKTDGLPFSDAECATGGETVIKVLGGGYTEVGVSAANRLAKYGPMLFEADLPKGFEAIKQHDVIHLPQQGKRVGHSMLLVGYNWPKRTATFLGSHGSGWGNGGFATFDLQEIGFFERNPFEVKV